MRFKSHPSVDPSNLSSVADKLSSSAAFEIYG